MAGNPIEQELLALTDASGFIKPFTVVTWARKNPHSHLHKRFEWNDRLAAEQHRLDQARQLIAVYVRADDGHRATISLVEDRHQAGGYRRIEQVMSSADMRAIALRQALAEFHRWRDRYRYMVELAQIFAAADAINAEIPPAPVPVGAIASGAAAAAEVAGA
jgi:hypothetical protein